MILVNKLAYRIGDVDLLKDINCGIAENRVSAILGPNGAGKSTLLKCLCGSIREYEGHVMFKGIDILDYSLSKLARQRSVLSQLHPISFPFSVREIVLMGRSPFTPGRRNEDEAIVDEVLSCVDAQHLVDRVFPSLSGGEQQRVQFARALAQIWQQEQAVLFLDEPTSALDIRHQHLILQLAHKLVENRGLTVVCVLHDLNLAQHYTDEVLLMKGGRLFLKGKTIDTLNAANVEEVFDVPASLVRQFHLTNKDSADISAHF